MKSSFAALDKKVPESKRYSHVQSSIDTGASVRKQEVVSAGAAAKRRGEVFKRIRASTLVKLISEHEICESVYALGSADGNADDGRSISSVKASKAGASTAVSVSGKTAATATSSVAGSVVSVVDSDTTVSEARDVVLLDVREPHEYEACRLPLAVSYPAVKINRDQFSAELHRCKRDSSKLLVIYHSNDHTTAGVATLLAQKGWESVHALSGGFEEIVASYPEVLEGEVPERPETGSTNRTVRSSAKSRAR